MNKFNLIKSILENYQTKFIILAVIKSIRILLNNRKLISFELSTYGMPIYFFPGDSYYYGGFY